MRWVGRVLIPNLCQEVRECHDSWADCIEGVIDASFDTRDGQVVSDVGGEVEVCAGFADCVHGDEVPE